jgi:hypothetical protein
MDCTARACHAMASSTGTRCGMACREVPCRHAGPARRRTVRTPADRLPPQEPPNESNLPVRLHLVRCRPAARRLQAVRIRQGDPAVHRAAATGLRAGAHQGRRAGRKREQDANAGLNPDPFLLRRPKQSFYNTSPLDLPTLLGDQDHIRQNLYAYIQGFSPAARDIFERFDFHGQVERLAKSGLLYLVTEKFANIDLHPDACGQRADGPGFEELIRKFAELSNETAGEHFTPREVIRLMVNLLFIEDDDVLTCRQRRGAHDLRPHGRHRRHAVGRGRIPAAAQPGRALEPVRAGTERRILRHLQGRHADQGPGRGKHRGRQHPVRGWPRRPQVRLHALQSAVRRGMEEGGEGHPQGARGEGLRRPFRPRPAARVRWFDAVPAAPALEDAPLHRRAAAASASCSTARRCSPAARAAARARSAATCWRTIWWKPSSPCPPTCSTTPASPPTSGCVSNKKPADRKGKVQLIDASGFWQKMRKSLGSKRKEMSNAHIADGHAPVRRLCRGRTDHRAGCRRARPRATRSWWSNTDDPPRAPEGGKVKRVPIARIFRQ